MPNGIGCHCLPSINETLQKIIECALALKRHVVFHIIFRQRLSKFSVFVLIINAISKKGFRHYSQSRPNGVLMYVSVFRDAFS